MRDHLGPARPGNDLPDRPAVIERRTAPDADAEFQEVAGLIRKELQKLAPEVFPAP